MKAVIFTQYGSPDVLELKEIPKPVPKDDEVLIKNHAVSVNDWDWLALQGTPFVNRMIFGLQKPKIHILGSDIAGIIETVGNNVTQFKPGDAVYGDLSDYWGGFAEYVCAKQTALALKPDSMSFEEAAAIPQAGTLAAQSLLDYWQLQSGQTILINGAGGGVGTFALQIIKAFDIEVTGVDNKYKLDMMLSQGFDYVIDYEKEDFTRLKKQYDLIIDNKTIYPISRYLRVVKPNGTYLTVGAPVLWILKALLSAPLISFLYKKRVRTVMLKYNKYLPYFNDLYNNKTIKPIIDTTFSLKDVPEAMRYFGKAQHKGKVIIKIV